MTRIARGCNSVAALVDALARPRVVGAHLDVQFDHMGAPVLSYDQPQRGANDVRLDAILYLIDAHSDKLWLIEIKPCQWSVDRVGVLRDAMLARRDTVVVISSGKHIIELLSLYGLRTALIERADGTHKINLPDNLGVAWVRRDCGDYNIC